MIQYSNQSVMSSKGAFILAQLRVSMELDPASGRLIDAMQSR